MSGQGNVWWRNIWSGSVWSGTGMLQKRPVNEKWADRGNLGPEKWIHDFNCSCPNLDFSFFFRFCRYGMLKHLLEKNERKQRGRVKKIAEKGRKKKGKRAGKRKSKQKMTTIYNKNRSPVHRSLLKRSVPYRYFILFYFPICNFVVFRKLCVHLERRTVIYI